MLIMLNLNLNLYQYLNWILDSIWSLIQVLSLKILNLFLTGHHYYTTVLLFHPTAASQDSTEIKD